MLICMNKSASSTNFQHQDFQIFLVMNIDISAWLIKVNYSIFWLQSFVNKLPQQCWPESLLSINTYSGVKSTQNPGTVGSTRSVTPETQVYNFCHRPHV